MGNPPSTYVGKHVHFDGFSKIDLLDIFNKFVVNGLSFQDFQEKNSTRFSSKVVGRLGFFQKFSKRLEFNPQ